MSAGTSVSALTALVLVESGGAPAGPALPGWFDVLAMALAGAFAAAAARAVGFPVVGTLVAGVVTGLGGGMVRDVLLGHEPIAIAAPVYIPMVAAAAVVGAVAGRWLLPERPPFLILHGLTWGFLTTIGAQTALHAQVPPVSAVVLGAVTASVGGVIVDAISGRASPLTRQAHWFVTALLVGSALFVLCSLTVGFWAGVAVCVPVTAGLHAASVLRNWPSPRWPPRPAHAEESA